MPPDTPNFGHIRNGKWLFAALDLKITKFSVVARFFFLIVKQPFLAIA